MCFIGKMLRCNVEQSIGTYWVLHSKSGAIMVISQIVNFYVVSTPEMRGASPFISVLFHQRSV
jgi:hypothetical protein